MRIWDRIRKALDESCLKPLSFSHFDVGNIFKKIETTYFRSGKNIAPKILKIVFSNQKAHRMSCPKPVSDLSEVV